MISKQNEMKQIPCRLLFVAFYFLNLHAYGQTDSALLITANFENARVEEFLGTVEEQTRIRFFYDSANFDSVRITVHANQLPLRQVLDQAFRNTDIYYSSDDEHHYFPDKGRSA